MNIEAIRVFLLDMDGTIYLGNKLLPGAIEFFDTLHRQGKKYYFLTNNSSSNAASYARKLLNLGLSGINPDQVITSGQCAAWHLRHIKRYSRVFLMGTRELELEFLRFGFVLVQDQPDCVVLGYDKTLTWPKLEQASTLIRQGCPFYATHPDLNCPTESGLVIDIGSLIKAIEASTGVRPQIFGKPFPEMVNYALERSGSTREQTAILGDRLYTDIAMGKQSGILSMLVLTGESRKSDITASSWKPDLVFPSLKEINEALQG
ncbi:MAG TPA: HAD-IIA family hydrolase [Atribacteraceae bacterium]|nr:HAD-IIA family hydrolase [Atribacteraceae bacterium]